MTKTIKKRRKREKRKIIREVSRVSDTKTQIRSKYEKIENIKKV